MLQLRCGMCSGAAAVALPPAIMSLHPPTVCPPRFARQVDSEELQAVQQRLLEVLLEAQPDALYPAALCALADLREVRRLLAAPRTGSLEACAS